MLNTCAGGLDLWRIVSLELPHGCPAFDAGPTSELHGGVLFGVWTPRRITSLEWRITSLQLPYGHPELVGPVFQSSSLGDPQNKCSKRHVTTSNVVQSQEKLVHKQVLKWTSTRHMLSDTHTSVIVAHRCPSPASALSSANFDSLVLLFPKNRPRHRIRF